MLKQAIQRPIGVLMATLAIIIISIVFIRGISISLLPDIPIPRITVHISAPDLDARTLENTVTRSVRSQLLQVNHLKDLESRTRNGSATIDLQLEYGINTNLSYIEINEKMDQIMTLLPKNLERPRVIQTNISDIPVFYLNMEVVDLDLTSHLELSEFAKRIIRRRLEQQEEIAFVDMHGLTEPEVVIQPRYTLLSALNISEDDLIQVIRQSNVDLGNVLIRDGHYEYYIRLNNRLSDIDDVRNIIVNLGNQNYNLSQLADISMSERERRGSFMRNDRRGLSMAIRKKAGSNNFALRQHMDELLTAFEKDYPNIRFSLANDQSKILQSSFNSLRQSLFYGLGFAGLVLFFFFRDWRLPLLIVLVIPIGLIITLFAFYLLGLSINIISLSGLILGVGLMIDNSIIITENIKQHQSKHSLAEACSIGANEVIRPLISSALTTCSVFLPLILLSGLAGSLFYDQALSISISLTASLIVSYFLLPVLAHLLFRKNHIHHVLPHSSDNAHGKIINGIIKLRWPLLGLFMILLIACYYVFLLVDKEAFPQITRSEYQLSIDWNEPISLEESELRISALFDQLKEDIIKSNAYIGELQYLLLEEEQNLNEVDIVLYFNAPPTPSKLEKLNRDFKSQYPNSLLKVQPLANVFDRIFGSDPVPVYAHIQSIQSVSLPEPEQLQILIDTLRQYGFNQQMPPMNNYIQLNIDYEKLLLYNVSFDALLGKLKAAFRSNVITQLKSNDAFVPIQLTQLVRADIHDILAQQKVRTSGGDEHSLAHFVSLTNKEYYKTIPAGRSGERISLPLKTYEPTVLDKMRSLITSFNQYTVQYDGSYYDNQKTLNELLLIGLLVLALLYLILAAQFESFIQPLIIALTLPMGTLGALTALYLFGESLNVMSLVGIIVLSGIDVNDAILKVDIFNRNRSKGMDVRTAIIRGSEQRLRPIVMTSLTTILAMLPILYAVGLGGELQRPLAVALIGGLLSGTVASIVMIPVFYSIVYKRN